MKIISKLIFWSCAGLICCRQATDKASSLVSHTSATTAATLVNTGGMTIQDRFNVPAGYERIKVEKNSFGNYLRNLALKPAGSKVRYYNGALKSDRVYIAVVDMDIGNQNLQQCADAVMRLRGEYFYSRKEYDKISFNLTNGFTADYSEWMKGNRIAINGNNTYWKKSTEPSNTYTDFRNYMDFIFSYAGTISLSKSLHSKELKDIGIGDVFIYGGSPGHAEIVVDVAENIEHQKIFMLAQSYMPAQETQILRNFKDEEMSPWYSAEISGDLETPSWTFTTDQLKSW